MAISQSSAVPPSQDTKRCTKCGEEKNLTEFSKDLRRKFGVRCSCNSCERKRRLINKEYQQNWLNLHAGYMRTYCAKWRDVNPSYSTIASDRWRKNNPEKNKAIRNNRRARKLNAKGSHTAFDIQQLLVLQKSKCAVCHVSITNGYHVDHVIPLALNGGNGKDNLQLLCPHCNLSKNAQHPVDFMQSRGMLL